MTENEDGTVTLTASEYAELLNDSVMLTCLENGGVDNWEWYEAACEEFEGWKKENGRE